MTENFHLHAFLGKGKEQEKGKEEVCEMLKVLDNDFKDKKLFVGDKFGFVDIVANLVELWMGVFQEATGVVLATNENFPNFCARRDTYMNCSQVKEYLPSRIDELLVFYQAYIPK
uniref:GST C-terminal domain-containing protein n=1 Tax=Solanum lycopersicum TaxID=4081 RepID=A0A3Q7HYN7_SOLLC